MNPNATQSRIIRFKDSLFINTTAVNNQEQSAWSPLTPSSSSTPPTTRNLFTRFSHAAPGSASSGSAHIDSHSSNTSSSPLVPRPSSKSMLKDAFGRMLRQPTSPTLPISRPILIGEYGAPNYNDLPSFGPLASEKPRPTPTRHDPMVAQRKKRRRNIYIAAALMTIIVVVVIILAVRLVKSRNDSRASTESPPPSTSGLLTSEQSKCLNDFTTSAPSAPLDYPVGCLKTLQSVSKEFTTADPSSADVMVAAKHFSALRLLFDGCSAAAQQGLNAGGWFKDTKLCAWTGVQCNGSGHISQLTFTRPNVPNSIPAEGIIALDALASFVVKGTGSLPSGSLPGMPPSLRDLELNNTALGPLDNSLFAENGGLSKLQTLVLVQNTKMGSSILDGMLNLSLKSLTVQYQGVAALSSNFLNSTMARGLTFLDLSNNVLTNTVPNMSSLANLITLNLASNNFTTISQTTSFPQTLQNVLFFGNQNLAGVLPPALCSSATLKTCDFSKTIFLGGTSCGICKFG